MVLSLVMNPPHSTFKPTIPSSKTFNDNICSSGNKTCYSNFNARFGQPIRGNIRILLRKRDIEVKAKLDNVETLQVDMSEDKLNGRLLENGRVFRQNFSVRSFDVGSDLKIYIGNLLSYLQETALNQCKSMGLLADGFGSTPQMYARNLIWVIRFIHMEVEAYPLWGDVVQVDARFHPWGSIGYRHSWHFRDSKTGKTLAKATGLFILMNKTSRKLTKLGNEIVEELNPYVNFHDDFIVKQKHEKLMPLNTGIADYVVSGLTPAMKDLDANNHVSHLKYVDYLLQSIPRSIQESYDLIRITLEYRQEADRNSVIQSLSRIIRNNNSSVGNLEHNDGGLGLYHSLQLESEQEIVRARTEWKLKNV